ncbi:hypothetical protein IMCC3317_22130 [Kordia antarctica]|uniref:Uncharacterized protein n=1 Tax=Kordia antarctica TaxID=1218801 RepID=A0A7L4ZJE9_9FLAO|nr:DUF6498-containing protein [Kordia antarctica]QHI36843.1 hypothetical protein IMCC3317_22130 [Kordia antarctica]
MKEKINIHIIPNRQNAFIWFNVLFVATLLLTGETNAFSIVMAYFMETLIIGAIHVFKMFIILKYANANGVERTQNNGGGMILFFIFHYTFFVAIQSMFVFVLLEMKDPKIDPFSIFENVTYIFQNYDGIYPILISLAVFNIADFYLNFLMPKAYEKISIEKSILSPYGRIFVQQFAVILGFFFFIFSFALDIIALLIVGIKATVDFYIVSNPEKNPFKGKIDLSKMKNP